MIVDPQKSTSIVVDSLSLRVGDKNQKRNERMERQHSRDSIFLEKKKQQNNVSTSVPPGRYLTKSEPMTFLELVNKNAKENKKRGKKKALRRRSALSTSSQSKQKSVRFATHPATEKVWAMTRQYDPEPEERHQELWWTSDEMYDRYESDMDLIERVEDDYGEALDPAYHKDHLSSKDVHLEFDQVYACSAARGLEAEIMPEIGQSVKKQRRAVLKAQTIFQQEEEEAGNDSLFSGDLSNSADSKWKLIRARSLKYSRRSALIAQKMAEFDRTAVMCHL